jgi:hypothetical protein
MDAELVTIVRSCRCGLVSVVPPEDGQVMPETCRENERE